MKRFITFLATITVLAGIAACGDDEPKSGNGVNSTALACEIRAKWNRTGNDKCSLCESAAQNARCDCEALKDFSGACVEQADKRKAACTDANLDPCIFGCDAADCACVAKCYETATAACKSASDARDGCVAETCDSHCK